MTLSWEKLRDNGHGARGEFHHYIASPSEGGWCLAAFHCESDDEEPEGYFCPITGIGADEECWHTFLMHGQSLDEVKAEAQAFEAGEIDQDGVPR
jgi:hypothetical protein